jgi:hypothetical protein
MPEMITIAYIHHGIDVSAFLLSKFGDGRGTVSISSGLTLEFISDFKLTSSTVDGGGFSVSWTFFTTSPMVSAVVRGVSVEQPLIVMKVNAMSTLT